MVISKMEELFGSSFRDVAELNQATQFLHENGIKSLPCNVDSTSLRLLVYCVSFCCLSTGVLLHYDDVSLQDVYFLDPQWLCDILANVVTIREINSLARCGMWITANSK